VGRGIYLRTHAHALLLDHSAQDVVMLLGPPQAVHFRHGAYVVSGATQHRMAGGTSRHGGGAFGKQRRASAAGQPSLAALGHDGALECRVHRRWRCRVAPMTTIVRWSPGSIPNAAPAPSYYWNYFDLGLDVLFDGENHDVQAIVLHTNCPGHAYFGLYRRANFFIEAPNSSRTGA